MSPGGLSQGVPRALGSWGLGAHGGYANQVWGPNSRQGRMGLSRTGVSIGLSRTGEYEPHVHQSGRSSSETRLILIPLRQVELRTVVISLLQKPPHVSGLIV